MPSLNILKRIENRNEKPERPGVAWRKKKTPASSDSVKQGL
jgi:hypothetical protein